MSKIIVISTDKGGSGKTTLCRHIGKGLHDSGLNVVIYDCDQSNNLMNFLNRRREEVGDENLDFPEIKLFPLKIKEHPQSYLLRDSPDADVIIVDMVGKLGILHASLMSAADIIIIPTMMDVDAVDGAIATFNFIDEYEIVDPNTDLPIPVLARVKWNKRSPAARILDKNEEYTNLLKFDSIINDRSMKYVHSSTLGMTAFDMVKSNKDYEPVAFECNKLNKEIIKMISDIDTMMEDK